MPALLTIHNFRLNLIIGTYPHERLNKQDIFLDIELKTDISEAAVSDELSHALDYDALTSGLKTAFENTEYELMLDYISENSQAEAVRLKLTKPSALTEADAVSICLSAGKW